MKSVTMCCTTCPSSCALEVTVEGDQVVEVTGNNCPRGTNFAQNEWTNPVRVVTSTVLGNINGKDILIPVKTKEPISKNKIKDVMQAIRKLRINRPVRVGDILDDNTGNCKVDLLACKTIEG